jgi:hypothetical protein
MCGLQIARRYPDRNSQSVPPTASEKGRLGFSTRKDLHVLCYQHHTEMPLRLESQPTERQLYSCRESGCLVRYTDSDGYFLDTKEAKIIEQETTPHVTCLNDGQLMYLAVVTPEERSFRLWKCPQCNSSLTNEETSGGLGKGAEA